MPWNTLDGNSERANELLSHGWQENNPIISEKFLLETSIKTFAAGFGGKRNGFNWLAFVVFNGKKAVREKLQVF